MSKECILTDGWLEDLLIIEWTPIQGNILNISVIPYGFIFLQQVIHAIITAGADIIVA